MTRRFTCRGFEGGIETWGERGWCAFVMVAGIQVMAIAYNKAAAKSRVRRKLDAVERAFRERGKR
ncbi:MAG TPA: hypothetical protein VGK73_38165 [Polyangiaceae bacterium]